MSMGLVRSAGRDTGPEDRGGFAAPLLVIVGVAVVAAAAALAAKAELATAIPLIALASGAITLAAVLSLAGRVHWGPALPASNELDPGVPVHEALVRKGAFGRQLVLAHLEALDRGSRGAVLGITREEELRVLAMPPKEFLDWTESQLALLEART